jgi:hypothetical protein
MDNEDYFKDYYREHKEILDARSKEWKLKNREKWNEYQKEYKRKKYIKKKKDNEEKS